MGKVPFPMRSLNRRIPGTGRLEGGALRLSAYGFGYGAELYLDSTQIS
jgi:hypothetical protein